MGLGDLSLACASALVDELVRAGVRDACLSPGSRSTPLALALGRHPDITLHVMLDERASGFFAVGLAKAVQHPVVVACTSGTAAAELFPAVIEASQARVPLVALTADRPPDVRGTGANQTIDQVELYGAYVRAYEEPLVPGSPADVVAWRGAARRAWQRAWTPPFGPVHVNCPFDEPLVPEGDAAPELEPDEPPPFDRPSFAPSADDVASFASGISGKRGVVVAGGATPEPAARSVDLAERLGWPLLAEPLSGLRTSSTHPTANSVVCRAPQALAGDAAWARRHRPEVVVQVGAAPTTRAMQAFVASAEELLVVDHWHLDPDPRHLALRRFRVDPDELFRRTERVSPAPEQWLAAWRVADDAARGAVDVLMNSWDEPFEPRVARDLAAFIPNGGILFVGNSTPVRDLDLAMMPRTGVRVLANRGASGIDGLVATTLGVAAARRGSTYGLLGDLSFLYDVGALVWSQHAGVDAVLVVVDNGGGEIFSLLPQVDLPEHRALFVTPHGLDLQRVCEAAGVGHRRVERMRDFSAALHGGSLDGGVQVVSVEVHAPLNRRRRDDLRAVVGNVLRGS
jgi:2-succinyl-5-enolpyruvyl-6-hydroxy-3-cyclohexene-1-carboxylate synthase